ncbi:MAG: dihydrofolate reductase family protein [Chitinophagales bacterium]|jgi:diaminohydroxyphosphoribosylaminopyrimidine deaminase/5-amino-6-(5-phosphoribosylamino)uracil reductase|nr:dihydrofolate reductase family protein [Chitinophagales bacterium]
MTLEDIRHRMLILIEKSGKFTKSNPRVAAILIHNEKIMSEGIHYQFGQAHAEVNCLNYSQLDESLLVEAHLYISLEPCSHFGKTPPCVDLIKSKKIPRVTALSLDWDEITKNKASQELQGIDYQCLNDVSFMWNANFKFSINHLKKRPSYTLKYAKYQFGNVYGNSEKRIIITNAYSKRITHELRARHDAIMISHRTLRLDNPKLNTRKTFGDSPEIIIWDRYFSLDYTVYQFDQKAYVLNEVFQGDIKENFKAIKLENMTDIQEINSAIYNLNIRSVLIESAGGLANFFLSKNNIDEIYQHISLEVYQPVDTDLRSEDLTWFNGFKLVDTQHDAAQIVNKWVSYDIFD